MGPCGKLSTCIAILAIVVPVLWIYRDQREFNFRTTAEEAANNVDWTGRTAIVTGASAGIGIDTARVILQQGMRSSISFHVNALVSCNLVAIYQLIAGGLVVMGCRNIQKAKRARSETINQVSSNTNVAAQDLSNRLRVIELDLASVSSIHSFVKQFSGNYSSLDFLVLNAGLNTAQWGQTKDGIEMHFGVNHVGHFILTDLLIPKMKIVHNDQQSIARVVVVSSWAHHFSPKPLVDWLKSDMLIQNPETFNPMTHYGFSKSCNILFAREFNERYAANGIHAVSVHPGTISTELVREMPGVINLIWREVFGKTIFKSRTQGAATTIRVLSVSDEEFMENGGKYWSDCNVAEQDLRSDLFPTDVDEKNMPQKLLWELTTQVIDQTRNVSLE